MNLLLLFSKTLSTLKINTSAPVCVIHISSQMLSMISDILYSLLHSIGEQDNMPKEHEGFDLCFGRYLHNFSLLS